MATALVTGSGGLVGSECARYFAKNGFDVIGIENNMRASFFGPEASTQQVTDRLIAEIDSFRSTDLDIRDVDALGRLFREQSDIQLIIHAAAQPSHDWAATDPQTDFSVNANGTLNLLESARAHCPDAVFIFCSTNKVYGDLANSLPLVELPTRFELEADHQYFQHGIDTTMSIDRSLHSLFGASKAAADLLVQEYGRYFEMPTACFRAGCITGPSHAGVRLHGFLAYLMKCTVTGEPYTVYGYKGKQVRDNIHSLDLARAFAEYAQNPQPAAVYNIGGGRACNCSMIEAIELCQGIAEREVNWSQDSSARAGDHIWWISDLRQFSADYSNWGITYTTEDILREIYEQNVEHWLKVA